VNNKECQTVSARWEGTRKRGRPRKRWTNEAEEDLKEMGITDFHTVVKNRKEWTRTVFEAKVRKRN
jgi:hypothetical protein